jgi:hypothetical protein
MTDAPAPAAVSLSRSPRAETARHPAFRRDSAEAASETVDLKALAQLVLARDGRRDFEGGKLSRRPPQIEVSGKTVAGETERVTWGQAEEERAAIVEHDGLIPRAWAEGLARLDPDRPPSDVPSRRWLQFIDDVGRFLDDGWAERAAALGWGSYDLFGCDCDKPVARIDQAGLVWLLNGDRLVAFSENVAAVETRTCARQTYRRKPSEPGRVLAWEFA